MGGTVEDPEEVEEEMKSETPASDVFAGLTSSHHLLVLAHLIFRSTSLTSSLSMDKLDISTTIPLLGEPSNTIH